MGATSSPLLPGPACQWQRPTGTGPHRLPSRVTPVTVLPAKGSDPQAAVHTADATGPPPAPALQVHDDSRTYRQVLVQNVFKNPFMWIISVFFFSSRRRHTRFDCDWSSDVCSSD